MDLGRIVIRVVFAYLWVLVMVRVTGRRTIKQGDVASFVLALVMGDLFDDFFWGEVPAAQFVTAIGTLAIAHLWSTVQQTNVARRSWRRAMLQKPS